MDQEYILVILLANAASTPSFPKVSDNEPLINAYSSPSNGIGLVFYKLLR
jgi:hypothetical protein